MEQDNYSISWKDLPWKKFKKKSFRLQCKIYEAKQKGNSLCVNRLQKLFLYSKSAHYIAIRTVLRQNSLGKTHFRLSDEMLSKLVSSLPNLIHATRKTSMKVIFRYGLSDESRLLCDLKLKVVDYLWEMSLHPVLQAIVCNKNSISTHIWDLQRGIISNLGILSYGADKKLLEIMISTTSLRTVSIFSTTVIGSGLPISFKLTHYKVFQNEVIASSTLDKVPFLQGFLRRILWQGSINLDNEREKRLISVFDCIQSNFACNDTFLYILKKDPDGNLLLPKMNDFLGMRHIELSHETVKSVSSEYGFNFSLWHFKAKTNWKCVHHPDFRYWDKYKGKIKSILSNSADSIFLRIEKLMWTIHRWFILHQFSQMNSLKSKMYCLKVWLTRSLMSSSIFFRNVMKFYLYIVFSRI